ncbi:sensor histidine kinase [Brevibacterium aurantiacum]|uniref:histidine kinase n=1 Tax=Brevibacterium aurantiacum TaxID=273384 RepID=A0A556CDM9_BREAU|nr:ATP-binding protein [Brevibacterium aurantiacum]TSI15562.1 hypothetical protein FO013_12495 [Brevibacterium aurantiacum]
MAQVTTLWETVRGRWPRARIAALVAAINTVAFSALVAEQATEWSSRWETAALLWWVGGLTVVIGAVLIIITIPLCALVASWWIRIIITLLLSAVQSSVRTALLLPATTLERDTHGGLTIWVTGMSGYLLAIATGFLVAALFEREDRERALRRDEEARTREAVSELEREELRVRKIVADRLHGTVQHRLVVVAGGLDQVADRLMAGDDDPAQWAPTLRDWALDLDELREEHVRSLSHSLFPSGADLGTYEAIRALLDRLPPTVATTVDLGPTMKELIRTLRAPLPLQDRLVVIYTTEEAVTNAIKHGGADRVTVRVEALKRGTEWVLDVRIDDNGTGPESEDPPLSGLARHRARAESRGGSLRLERNDEGGGRLHLMLPFVPESPRNDDEILQKQEKFDE